MQVAEILSDLTSLRVCDYDAALALVTAYKNVPGTNTKKTAPNSPTSSRKRSSTSASNTSRKRSSPSVETFSSTPHRPVAFTQRNPSEVMIGVVDKDDVDLQRAIDLMDLHYGLKMKHVQSLDMGLQKARLEVNRALQRLKEDGKGSAR